MNLMADDLRCPMCGKSNPADAEVCRYCQARLTPLTPQDDEPDWLRQLRSETPQTHPPDEPGADQEGDVPDWLARIRQKAGEQDPAASSGLFADDDQDDSAPDWMKSLQPEDTSPASFHGADDWLSRLGDEPQGETPAPEEGQTPDLAGWLKDLGAEDSPDKPVSNETPVFDDWSGGSLFADEPPAVDQPAQPADTNDWLSVFKEDDAPQPETRPEGSGLWADEPAGEVPHAAGDTPDWLRNFESELSGSSTEQPPAALEPPSAEPERESSGWGLTGWLTQDGEPADDARPEMPEPADQGEDQPAAADELPDWLSSLPAAPLEQEPSASTGDAVPSWLQGGEAGEARPQAAVETGPQEEVPDWLSGFAAPASDEAPLQQEGQPAHEAGPEEVSLPDWLAASGDTGVETPAAAEAPGDIPIDDQLAWFAAIDDRAAAENPPDEIPAETAELESIPQPADEQPDWLQSLQAAGDQEGEPEAAAAAGPAPFVEEGLPDWMDEFKGHPPAENVTPPLVPAEEFAAAFTGDDLTFSDDLPDWLSDEAAERQSQEAPAEGELAQEDLAQAELPSWVAAMRPVESAMQGEAGPLETDHRVEQAGPLSGIRGVLPADEQVISYRKPPVYSVKLRVTEKQRMHAALLENLLGQEVQPQVLPRERSQAPQILMRVLVALFFVLALAGSLLVSLQLAPAPTFYPPEVIDLYDQVEALPAGATVLMAVDYEPGLSGEMQFAASMVLDHLMGRNAQIAVVSTVPTGPALAETLLAQVQRSRAEYNLDAQVVNLGYLPGGSMSLVEFARDPRSAAPGMAGPSSAWDLPVLARIHDIQDFDRVLVVTDRAEAGRDWVEQVQPYLGDVPLLIVSSAQAAPLLEPYVESRQVHGLVAGQMGGTLYGQRTGRQAANPALGHYGAYQVGVLLAFVLTLIGAIFSAISSGVRGKRKNRE